jgi:AcrR family transcriptional regulator
MRHSLKIAKPEVVLRAAPARRGSRQQARTDATRRKLLAAAEKIFARSGYEAARLEDIATMAGYTRGAFYANFESKEDIFFALLEDWISEKLRSITSLLARYETRKERAVALRQYYVEMAHDRRLVLFSLEYKLFAVRHPEAYSRAARPAEEMRGGNFGDGFGFAAEVGAFESRGVDGTGCVVARVVAGAAGESAVGFGQGGAGGAGVVF